MSSPQLRISTAPFLQDALSTPKVMIEVVLALVPVIAASIWFFGISAILVLLAATAGAVGTEWLFMPDKKGLGTLRDGSALLTGLLLALTLPPGIPLWIAFLGGVMAIGLGKLIWGGLGQNLFNPALVGRAFLQAAFPTTITTWSAVDSGFMHIEASTFAAPLLRTSADVVSTATPLALSKFDGQVTELMPLLMGNTGGSLGETAGGILILCGLWLAWRRIFDWRLPLSTLLTVAVFSALLHFAAPETYPNPGFMLLSGGLMLGAVFMVTDPVNTPLSTRGPSIFGVGVGLLVVLIRLFGGLPEGVMYAILLMNSCTPLINRWTQPRRFGG